MQCSPNNDDIREWFEKGSKEMRPPYIPPIMYQCGDASVTNHQFGNVNLLRSANPKNSLPFCLKQHLVTMFTVHTHN